MKTGYSGGTIWNVRQKNRHSHTRISTLDDSGICTDLLDSAAATFGWAFRVCSYRNFIRSHVISPTSACACSNFSTSCILFSSHSLLRCGFKELERKNERKQKKKNRAESMIVAFKSISCWSGKKDQLSVFFNVFPAIAIVRLHKMISYSSVFIKKECNWTQPQFRCISFVFTLVCPTSCHGSLFCAMR